MLLRKLRCVHFKNYTTIRLDFADQLNFIIGPNGAGKTTLLDAIHYLSLTKSAFNSIDTQNIQHAREFFAIEGQVIKYEKTYELQCTFQKHGGKTFKNNHKAYEKLQDHLGLFPVVLTTPYDIDLIQGGSEIRRKFFDSILCQLDRTYLEALIKYQYLLKQRNGFLRLSKGAKQVDRSLLASYDQQLIPLGQQLFGAREAFVKLFAPTFQKYYQYFVAAAEEAQLSYVSEVAEANFEQRFYNNLQLDLALQRTTMGIHRDDIYLGLNGHPLKRIGSQGQQKSFVAALKLAQFEVIHKSLQVQPLLLLDDIFDKLDEQRIERLIDLIAQNHFGQVFITDAKGQSSTAVMKQFQVDQTLIKLEQGTLVETVRR